VVGSPRSCERQEFTEGRVLADRAGLGMAPQGLYFLFLGAISNSLHTTFWSKILLAHGLILEVCLQCVGHVPAFVPPGLAMYPTTMSILDLHGKYQL
jgi:hypothetical protein